MTREYLKVTPTSGDLSAGNVPANLASLHKLLVDEPTGLLEKLNPLRSATIPRFEFFALSAGPDEPVEFYYGADAYLDTLETRLRAIYPSTFDIRTVEENPALHLFSPFEYTTDEFADALARGELLYEFADEERSKESSKTVLADEVGQDARVARPDGGTEWVEIGDESVALDRATDTPPRESWATIQRPTLTDEGTIFARPAVDSVTPLGLRWNGTGERKDDWMTTLVPFSESSTADESSTGSPLAAVVEQLSNAESPLGFQVVFQRRPSWETDGEVRKMDLAEGRDTLGGKIFNSLLPAPVPGSTEDKSTSKLSETVQQRVDRITAKTPKKTFTANLRLLGVPADDVSAEKLETRLDKLQPVFDSLDGPYYGLGGQRLTSGGWRQSDGQHARETLRHALDRTITTDGGRSRPDVVLNADELANFVLVPSADSLSVEGTRGTRAEQQSRNPLPRPHQDLMREFREGMAIGYAVDEDGEPEDEVTHIPPDLLTTHYLRAATTGAGKTKAQDQETLSLHENTQGPVIRIDHKGDGMAENYMRAHARRFGMTDLEENVIHFRVPDTLPGFSFFNLYYSEEDDRDDAVQEKADHYEEILKLVMDAERFDRATVAPTLIQALIKALFDEEHGLDNGLYRESTDRFAHRQLEDALDQLIEAGPPQPSLADAPMSSDDAVERVIRRQLNLDAQTFSNVTAGVANRLTYISEDKHLRRIFNNTERRFDFREVLDENTVIIFDLGDLREDAARIMTGLILTNLFDALRDVNGPRESFPDDYVVNLLIDEAASLVVSDIMSTLLEQGRGFRLSMGLAMQFPKQVEAEGDRKLYQNLLNNVGSTILGNIKVDRDLARAMAHEEMSAEEFAHRIRTLPRGEWIASLPSPTFGETGPFPFSLKPLPIPAGHPESKYPLTPREEERFNETLDTIHERAQKEYGVPLKDTAPKTRTPDELYEVLGIVEDGLDHAMASIVRRHQLRAGSREANEWISVRAVDEDLRGLFDQAGHKVPSIDELSTVRERSQYLETTVDLESDAIVTRLTDAGEVIAAPDTGDVRSAGGDDHDRALLQIEEELTALGFTVSILEQDGSEMPDAKATHPEFEQTFAIEVETTTPRFPVKVLMNLKRAQEAGHTPLFIVRPRDSQANWPRRIANILSTPLRTDDCSGTEFYTSDTHLTFNGGATSEGGVTAVRPVSGDGDSRRSLWSREDTALLLRDGTGTEHLRTTSLASLTKERVPAYYTYDSAAKEFLVHTPGQTQTYNSRAAFEAEWVRIAEPFIPEDDLATPSYGPDSYAIIVLPTDGEPSLYKEGETRPLSILLERSFCRSSASTQQDDSTDSENSHDTSEQLDWKQDINLIISRFAVERLTEAKQEEVTAEEVYDAYVRWSEEHGLDTDSKSWFARRLSDHIEFERTTRRIDGSPIRFYQGITLGPRGANDDAA